MLTELTHPVTALKEPVVLTTKDSKKSASHESLCNHCLQAIERDTQG